jgi:hypothetical protein
MAVVSVKACGKETKYYIDNKLKKKWDKIRSGKLVEEDDDKVYIVDGRERCLAGDTIIRTNRAELGRKHTILWMYNQYHNNSDKLHKFKQWDLTIPTYVRSFDGDYIKLHKIKDVVHSGKKELHLLELDNGSSIKCSEDHKIMTNIGFVELKDLDKEKHLVMCDTPKTNNKKTDIQSMILKHLNRDINICGLIYHPEYIKAAQTKRARGKRIKIHQLIYEAHLNKLSLKDFLEILITDKQRAGELEYVNSDTHCVHHIDFNHYNNDINNLQLITNQEHLKIHSKNQYKNFGQGIPYFVKIKNITPVGIENCYDIVCDEPNHNFSANDIIVHNSGKSLWAFQQAAYIDPTFIERFLNNEPAISFDGEKLLKGIKTVRSDEKITRCLVFDEAFRGLSNRATLSKVNKLIVQALMEMGQKNLVLFIVLPSFYLLDRYPAVLRSNALFHIKRPKKKSVGRGRLWKGFNFNKKAKLYNLGINRGWGYPMGTTLRGQFFGKYPGGKKFETKYRKIKHDALVEIETDLGDNSRMGVMTKRFLEQRNQLLRYLFRDSNMKLVQIKDILKHSKIKIGFGTVKNIVSKYRKERELNEGKSSHNLTRRGVKKGKTLP